MRRTLMTLTLILASAGCTDEADPADLPREHFVYRECGPSPESAEPGWVIIPGTYPGQTDRVCIRGDEYVARDRWIQDLRDWARCAEFASHQLGRGAQ